MGSVLPGATLGDMRNRIVRQQTVDDILGVLDSCCDSFAFPMLDNGYVYLAATRLSLFRSSADWALVTEVFGFSPRTGVPDTYISTFGSRLANRKSEADFISENALHNYLACNPNNEPRFVWPISEGDWIDGEAVARGTRTIELRGRLADTPSLEDLAKYGVEPDQPGELQIFELCRYLAAIHRDDVLATDQERRGNVPDELEQILVLDEWNHPDVVDDSKRPSGSETFRQLSEVLITGYVSLYRPSLPPNTHWKNWPEGGTL